MDSVGMMKMATGDGIPLRQGTGTGSREVFGGYRGLRRWNSRSIFCSGSFRVRRYIWVKGVRRWSTEGPMRQGGAPCRGGASPTLVTASGTSWSRVQVSWVLSEKKITFQKGFSVWTPFDILFLRNTEIGKKQQFWAGPPVNRLVPKNIKVENKAQYSPKQ